MLNSDIVAATTDGAAVMVKFGTISNFIYQTCYNHALHLAVTEVLYNKSTEIEGLYNDDSSSGSEYDQDDNASCSGNDNYVVISKTHLPPEKQNYKETLDAVRKIVKMFKAFAAVKNTILQNHSKEKLYKEYTLLLDCKTRWNSIEPMLERFLKMKDCIIAAVADLNQSNLFNADIILPLKELIQVKKQKKK